MPEWVLFAKAYTKQFNRNIWYDSFVFVSIENNQERKITTKIDNRLHNIHDANYGHLDISMWYTYKNFTSLFYLTISIIMNIFTQCCWSNCFCKSIKDLHDKSDKRFLYRLGAIHLHWCCNEISLLWKCSVGIPLWKLISVPLFTITSSNWNIFRVTGYLCREFTGHQWIPRTVVWCVVWCDVMHNDAKLWCFLWSAPEQTVV